MEKNKQRLQYTFRILGSHMQFIEMGYDEEEARKSVATIVLLKDGHQKDDHDFEEKLQACMQEKLRLVYIR